MPKHKKDHQPTGGIPPEAEGSPILFGGTPVVPSAETFAAARERNPLWYQFLEKAYEQFAKRPENVGILADPKGKGATVGQVGLVFSTFLGYQPYCILARPLPEKQLARLEHVVKYSPPELVEALKRLQLLNGGIYATTLHHDGKTGHAITVMSYSIKRDRFV